MEIYAHAKEVNEKRKSKKYSAMLRIERWSHCRGIK